MTQQLPPTTQAERLAALQTAAIDAASTTLNKAGVDTSEYKTLVAAKWLIVLFIGIMWAAFAFSSKLPAWAPTIVSTIGTMAIASIQQHYVTSRTQVKALAADTAAETKLPPPPIV